jgi:hypothetical protein
MEAKETYYSGKRDLLERQKRPSREAKRDLLWRQKRPTREAKEAYYRGKRGLL